MGLHLFPNSSETLKVSLEPFERLLELPQNLFDNFAKVSQGSWNDSLGLLTYPRASPPDGNLTITLLNGYTAVIPASELFSTSRLYDSSGFYSIINPDRMIAEVGNSTDPRYVPNWGIPFLTMNYIVMDYDEGTFQMAPAIRTDLNSEGGALIKALCTSMVSSPTSTPTALPTVPTLAAPVAHHNHTAAIIGGIVGGVIGLTLSGQRCFSSSQDARKGPQQGVVLCYKRLSQKEQSIAALDDNRCYPHKCH